MKERVPLRFTCDDVWMFQFFQDRYFPYGRGWEPLLFRCETNPVHLLIEFHAFVYESSRIVRFQGDDFSRRAIFRLVLAEVRAQL